MANSIGNLKLYDGFESGLGAWTVTSGVPTQDGTIFQTGAFSAKFNASAATVAMRATVMSQDIMDVAYTTFQYYHPGNPSASTIVERFQDGNNNIVTGFKVDASGNLVGKNADTSDGATIGGLSLNTWHFIEHWYYPSSGINQASIDGGVIGTWTNTVKAPWSKILIGINNTTTYINYFDEVNVYVRNIVTPNRSLRPRAFAPGIAR